MKLSKERLDKWKMLSEISINFNGDVYKFEELLSHIQAVENELEMANEYREQKQQLHNFTLIKLNERIDTLQSELEAVKKQIGDSRAYAIARTEERDQLREKLKVAVDAFRTLRVAVNDKQPDPGAVMFIDGVLSKIGEVG